MTKKKTAPPPAPAKKKSAAARVAEVAAAVTGAGRRADTRATFCTCGAPRSEHIPSCERTHCSHFRTVDARAAHDAAVVAARAESVAGDVGPPKAGDVLTADPPGEELEVPPSAPVTSRRRWSPRQIKAVLAIASSDETREYLCTIASAPDFLAATDGHQVIMVRRGAALKERIPTGPELTVIPATLAGALAGVPSCTELELELGQVVARDKAGREIATAPIRPPRNPYPPVAAVIPQTIDETYRSQMHDPASLALALSSLAKLGCRRVSLDMPTTPLEGLRIFGRADDVEAVAVVMPSRTVEAAQ